MRTAYTALIALYSGALAPDLVEALILVESGGRADAFRDDPTFAERAHLATHPIYRQWPVRASAGRYGLMQLAFVTAYEQGFREDPEALFIPALNLYWGCGYLQACLDWATGFGYGEPRTTLSALCAYQAGRNSKTSPKNVRPANVAYALSIMKILATWPPAPSASATPAPTAHSATSTATPPGDPQ